MSERAERQMTCPECGESAQEKAPRDLVSWEAPGLTRPGWSHRDGSSLCTIIGPTGGYEPAQPQPAESSADPPRADTARLDAPASMEKPDNWDSASRFGSLYDSEGQLIEGPIAPPGSILASRRDNPAPESSAFHAAHDRTAGIYTASHHDLEAAQSVRGVRSISCECDASPGESCTPQGDHLARYLRAETAGAIGRDYLKATIAGLDVLAPQAVVESAEPAGQ
jgi:hypothetical protein